MTRGKFREVYRHYAALIDNGTMQPGDRLPTHADISRLWNISHATATKAVSALRDDLYVRTTTVGTFVHLPKHQRLYRRLCDILNELEAMGQAVQFEDGGVPCIVGHDGGVCWNPEAGRWENPTA